MIGGNGCALLVHPFLEVIRKMRTALGGEVRTARRLSEPVTIGAVSGAVVRAGVGSCQRREKLAEHAEHA